MKFDSETFRKDLHEKRIFRPQRYMSLRDTAKAIGIEFSHLQKIESGNITNPGVTTFLRCCDWLKIKPAKYFIK